MHLLYMTLYLSDKFAPMQECYINKRTYPICHEHIQSLIAEGLSWGSNKPQQHMVLLKGKLVWFMIYFIKTTQTQSTLLSYYTCVAFIHVTGGSGSVHYFVSEGKCSFWWRDFTWYGGCRLGAVDLSHVAASHSDMWKFSSNENTLGWEAQYVNFPHVDMQNLGP